MSAISEPTASVGLTDAERKSLTDGIMADDRLGGDRSTFRAVARIKADAIATTRAEERARLAAAFRTIHTAPDMTDRHGVRRVFIGATEMGEFLTLLEVDQ